MDDDEIVLDPGPIEITIKPTYLPYSQWTIKRYLREDFNIELEWIHGYKCGRYPGYRRRYMLVDITTKRVINEWISLDDLRYFLADHDYPLIPPEPVKEKPKGKTKKRNPGAVAFLEAVEAKQTENGLLL